MRKLNRGELKWKAKAIYDANNLSYHNFRHIEKVLSYLGDDISDELFVAVLFHDSVYDAGCCDNEKESGAFFLCYSGFYALNINSERVLDLIYATENPFENYDDDEEKKKLVEADFSILQGSHTELVIYERCIFDEFSTVYTKSQYKKGRLEFLEKCLNHFPQESKEYEGASYLYKYVEATY